jgi:MFS family permease
MFLAASGEFLPHDIRYLGMSATDLCTIADCRVVGFMVHDRAAFGGALVAVGVLYTYLILFPLRHGEAWAWWLLAISAGAGFGSFLAYLGYGYLDTWHGLGTVLLLPVFVVGLLRSRRLVGHLASPLVLLAARDLRTLSSRRQAGRACLLLGAAGTALGGLMILWVGITDIFVPEDLAFMGLSVEQLQVVNPRLVPLMAHDRAGFGGAVFTLGLTAFFCLWCSPPTRALWEALLVSGGVALAAAVGVHGLVGYTDLWHLAPALAAAASMIIGLALTSPSVMPARGPT